MSRRSELSAIERRRRTRLRILEICVFAMLASLMFCSKLIMEAFPNLHLLGTLTMIYTLAFRTKALIPIYLYVFINGIYAGFAPWWVPYLYVWAVLWAVTMLLPKRMPKVAAGIVYPIVCCIHGLFFGVLYAPAQALMYGYNFTQTLLWIAQGFWFDVLHGIGNLFAGILVLPLSELIKKLMARAVSR